MQSTVRIVVYLQSQLYKLISVNLQTAIKELYKL